MTRTTKKKNLYKKGAGYGIRIFSWVGSRKHGYPDPLCVHCAYKQYLGLRTSMSETEVFLSTTRKFGWRFLFSSPMPPNRKPAINITIIQGYILWDTIASNDMIWEIVPKYDTNFFLKANWDFTIRIQVRWVKHKMMN